MTCHCERGLANSPPIGSYSSMYRTVPYRAPNVSRHRFTPAATPGENATLQIFPLPAEAWLTNAPCNGRNLNPKMLADCLNTPSDSRLTIPSECHQRMSLRPMAEGFDDKYRVTPSRHVHHFSELYRVFQRPTIASPPNVRKQNSITRALYLGT